MYAVVLEPTSWAGSKELAAEVGEAEAGAEIEVELGAEIETEIGAEIEGGEEGMMSGEEEVAT
jgi:hypothetical protein